MRNTSILTIISLLVGVALLSSCQKDSDVPSFAYRDPGCDAGRNGSIRLRLVAVHHTETIPSIASYPDTAFIKFNTSEFPGDDPSLFDLVIPGTPPDTFIVVDSMGCGNYFIFMTGKDVSIAERVKGGIPVTLFDTDTERTLQIPVTED